MKQLQVNEERAAWGTIRGYVYQVDLTIQRWLELEPNSELELERGEDVDTIQQAMLTRGKEQSRLLEQIKAREQGLTLRSSAALITLAYFYEHERKNPSMNLSYRYVTNAKIAKERNFPAAQGRRLISLWNQLRNDTFKKRDNAKSLSLIRDFLKSAKQPKDLSEATWKPFVKFISSATNRKFSSFIKKVEWLTHQTPTDLAAQGIQDTLVSKYEISEDEAQTVYSLLFLNVFKTLTQSGLKRLTTDGRATILASRQVSPSDKALLANLDIYITRLTERVGALEEAVSALQPRATPTVEEIRVACHKATKRMATAIVEDRKIITREILTNQIDEFLSSEERYCFIRGSSGVGKSTSVASEAQRLIEAGFIVLLMSGKDFSLQEAALQVARELWPPASGLSWQKLIEIIVQDDSNHARGFLLSVDGIDEADDLHEISLQLTKLHESLGSTPPAQVKIILSCRDIAWGRFSKQRLMPLYEDFEPSIPKSKKHFGGYSSRLITLRDFTTNELDRALHAIGATELINPGRFGADPSAHIATLRSLLRHPATFEHYSALWRNNYAISVEEVTWSYLIEERLRKALGKAGRQCRKSVIELRKLLEQIALLSWQSGSKNFELTREELQAAIPELSNDEDHEGVSTLAALVEHRILSELVVNNQSRISFNIADIGGYLLSFEFERQTQGRNPEQIRTLLKKWLDDSRDFQPLLDALLALMDLFADQPYSSPSLALVELLVESHRFQNRSLFGLMRPEVLKTIFEIIKEPDGHRLYGYREAALGIRSSPATLAEIRSHLNDEDATARQLAAELAGALHDAVAIEELIQLFRDPDKNVRRKVFQAFGHIGRSAISPLLKAINDSSQPVELRSSCMAALRNVGFRNSEVSATLRRSLEQSESKPELLKRSLLSAAGLRDRGYTRYATRALKSLDDQVITSAGKYLTEVPDNRTFSALRLALRQKTLALHEPPERFWIVNQLTAALWRTDKIRAASILLKLVERGLQNKGDVLPFQAVYFPNKIDLPAIPTLILKAMVKQLQQFGEGELVWRGSRTLGAIWHSDQLQALIAENKVLKRQDIDTAKLFVDAIIPGIQVSEEFPLANRLNLISDLHPLAKCQAANLAPEAARLFEHSGALGCAELSRLLWVTGDPRVEKTLIHRMANPSEEREALHERSDLVRALGTCSETAEAVQVVLGFMRTDGFNNISYEFEEETLNPLLYREIISDAQLIGVAGDATMPWPSRRASLLTLGWYDAHKYQNVFAEVAEKSVDHPVLQSAAILMLSVPGDKSVVPLLRRFLRKSPDVNIKEQAAQALARLDDVSSVHEIERALQSADASGFASALAHFRQETSLPVLIDRLSSASDLSKHEYLRALGAFWKFPQGKAAVLDQFDRWSARREQYLHNQQALINGLVDHEPDVILDQFNKSFDDGEVTIRARETMAKRLADLFYLKHANQTLLLGVARRLISDEHVPARERACHALRFAKRTFGLQLFKMIHDAPGVGEWERACAVYSLGFISGAINLISRTF